MAQELASHGFIVFIPDFNDGTCVYSELGEKDTNKPDVRNFNSFESTTPLMEHISNPKGQ